MENIPGIINRIIFLSFFFTYRLLFVCRRCSFRRPRNVTRPNNPDAGVLHPCEEAAEFGSCCRARVAGDPGSKTRNTRVSGAGKKKKKNPMSREITQGYRTANCRCHFSFSLWLLTLPSTTTTSATSPHAHTFLQVHCTPGTYQFFTAIISAPRGEGYINLTPLSAADTPARRRREPDPVSFLSNHFAQAYSAVRIHPG